LSRDSELFAPREARLSECAGRGRQHACIRSRVRVRARRTHWSARLRRAREQPQLDRLRSVFLLSSHPPV